jgi:T4-like virus tail tube protein gp19
MRRNVYGALASLIFSSAALSACLSGADPNAATDPTAEAVTETQGEARLAPRPGVVAHYALELDGAIVGWLDSASGGRATADIIVTKLGSDNVARKHLGPVKYEDISIVCGTGMSDAFYQWLQDMFDRKPSRRNGAVVATDFNFKEVSRLNFFQALITEVGMPAADAASKAVGHITLKLSPETTKHTRDGDGGKVQGKFSAKQKPWHSNDFRLTVDGLDTTGVSRVEAFVVKQGITEYRDGSQRETHKEPTSLEFPNLVVTLSEKTAEPWYQWHEDFVIMGDNAPGKEKTGALHYLTQDLKDDLFTLDFHGLGIFKLAPEDDDSGGDKPPKEKAEMYTQDATFGFKPKP